jgi:photosystem II stability/assembly factor-like uncharacterized protein
MIAPKRVLAVAATAAILAIVLLAVVPVASASPAGVKGFKANSLSWPSAQRGFVLGTVPCGQKLCSEVLATTDGGTTWAPRGRVPAPIATPGRRGITEIRFVNDGTGWAFGPDLYATLDGGRTWKPVAMPGGEVQVVALAADPGRTFAVFSSCHGFPCHRPLSLWQTHAPGSGRWSQVPLALPVAFEAGVAVFGRTVYVVDTQRTFTGQPDLFYASTDGGRHFASRPVPCDQQPDIALIQVVPSSPTDVALLCDGNPGFSKAVKFVYRSRDTGRTDTYAGIMGLYGIQAEMAVSPSGNLAVVSASDGSFIYINDHAGTNWTMTLALGDGGAGWNDPVYVSDKVAWAVYGPADFTNVGLLAVTRDGGRHWYPMTL